jgi:preprotein translocase subunit SecE
MGRIQRKKPGKAKKKKQQKTGTKAPATGRVDSRDGSKKTTVVKTADKGVIKKPAKGVIKKSAKGVTKKPAAAQKKNLPAPGVAAGIAKPNFIEATFQFLREVRVELKKVTWPSRKQTIGSTVVVLVLVLIISLFLGVVDMGLSSLIRVVLQ